MRSLLGLFLVVLAAGCSTTSSAGVDGGADGGTLDATFPNSCAAAGPAYVCQSNACGAGLVNIQDYICGNSADYCCAPVGEGGLDSSDDVSIFVDGAVFETGVDAGHDSGVDAGQDAGMDAGHDAGGSMDTGTSTDAPSQDATDASSDATTG